MQITKYISQKCPSLKVEAQEFFFLIPVSAAQ